MNWTLHDIRRNCGWVVVLLATSLWSWVWFQPGLCRKHVISPHCSALLHRWALDCATEDVKKIISQSMTCCWQVNIKWVGDVIKKTKARSYYSSAMLDDVEVQQGDYVSVKPADPSSPLYIGKVVYMWEDSKGEKMFHAHWFKWVVLSYTGHFKSNEATLAYWEICVALWC